MKFHIFYHHQWSFLELCSSVQHTQALLLAQQTNPSLRKGRSPSRSLTLHFTYPPSLTCEVIPSVKERVKTHPLCFPWLPLKVSIPLPFAIFFFLIFPTISVSTHRISESPQYMQALRISPKWDPSCVPGTGTTADWWEKLNWCFHNQPTEPHREKVNFLRQKQCSPYQKIIHLRGLWCPGTSTGWPSGQDGSLFYFNRRK